jgi:hypothetical protein
MAVPRIGQLPRLLELDPCLDGGLPARRIRSTLEATLFGVGAPELGMDHRPATVSLDGVMGAPAEHVRKPSTGGDCLIDLGFPATATRGIGVIGLTPDRFEQRPPQRRVPIGFRGRGQQRVHVTSTVRPSAGLVREEDRIFQLPHAVRTDGGDLGGRSDLSLGIRVPARKRVQPCERHVGVDLFKGDRHPGEDPVRRGLRLLPETELDEALEDTVEEDHPISPVGALSPDHLQAEPIEGQALVESAVDVSRPRPPPTRRSPHVWIADLGEEPRSFVEHAFGVIRLPQVRVDLPQDR